MAFRAAVLEAYLAECCVCGFSLRWVDGLIAVDAAHIRWHAHGGPDNPGNEPRLAPQEIDLDMKTGMKIAIVRGR
jgi:predicted restriction endonuclease